MGIGLVNFSFDVWHHHSTKYAICSIHKPFASDLIYGQLVTSYFTNPMSDCLTIDMHAHTARAA